MVDRSGPQRRHAGGVAVPTPASSQERSGPARVNVQDRHEDPSPRPSQPLCLPERDRWGPVSAFRHQGAELESRRVFTVEQRDAVRERLLGIANEDERVVAGAAVGSLAVGAGDRFSDLDLTFAVADRRAASSLSRVKAQPCPDSRRAGRRRGRSVLALQWRLPRIRRPGEPPPPLC